MESEAYQLLKQAFREKRAVGAGYDRHPRIFVVHALGWSRDHQERCHAWQFDGTSSQGTVPGWRCFDVRGLESIVLGDPVASYPQAVLPHNAGRPPICLARFDREVPVRGRRV
ncbi:MAG: hypothetical protein KF760_20725 [Candidatus Eremiobacteraeota bacterium]|nr:hypothetical protein [Candidatus Eremiobacteraeota bacterium]MCW5870465.1 hypothetical protein [Candidatus Eremiobacteraeota bacterium]